MAVGFTTTCAINAELLKLLIRTPLTAMYIRCNIMCLFVYVSATVFFILSVKGFVVFNATFNNMSVISWRSVLFGEGNNYSSSIFSQFLYITETCLSEDNILYQ
jgi:hypothetical protein